MRFLLPKKLSLQHPTPALRFWSLASFSTLASPAAWSHPPTCYKKDLGGRDPTLTKRGRQDSCVHENATHRQIAFIFMNVFATFSSNVATVHGRRADRSARSLVQCAIVAGPERRIAWSINPHALPGTSS
jgi:hypothetical protein